MNDDECSWIALSAATKNLVVLLKLPAAPVDGAEGESTAGPTGEDAAVGLENISTKCGAHNDTSKTLNVAGAVQRRQRGQS